MEHISDLFGETRIALQYKKNGKQATTERGSLLKIFHDKTGYEYGFLAKKLEGLSLKDLYFIESSCRTANITYKHCFDGMVKRTWG